MSFEALRSSKTLTILVVCTASFSDSLLQNIVIPILPSILTDRCGVAKKDVQSWNTILITAFPVALIFGSLLFGWIGDKLQNRQRPFMLGLIFSIGSTVCFALARSIPALLVGRLLQGLSNAIVSTFARVLLVNRLGDGHVGRAMGYILMATSVGLLIGPVLGGVLYQYAGYLSVYAVPIGLLTLEIVLRLLIIDKPAKEDGEDEPLTSGQGKLSYLMFLRSPRFIINIINLFVLSTVDNGLNTIVPTYAHDTIGLNTIKISVLFLLIGAPTILAPIGGWVADKYGTTGPTLLALVILTPAMFFLGTITQQTSEPFTKMALIFAAVGFSIASMISPLQADFVISAKAVATSRGLPDAPSKVYGLTNAVFAAGSIVGPLLLGYTRVLSGWRNTTILMGSLIGFILLLTITVICVGRFSSGKQKHESMVERHE